MKFCTYTSTPGLDRFAVGLRYRIWDDAHKELMRSDTEYRQVVRRFRFQIIISTLIYAIISPVFTLLQHRFADNTAFTVFCIVVPIVATFVYVFFVVYASLQSQCFMNERVGQMLQAKH